MQDSRSSPVFSEHPRLALTVLNLSWAAYRGCAVQSAMGPDSMPARWNRPLLWQLQPTPQDQGQHALPASVVVNASPSRCCSPTSAA